jgi:hypothetical protein
LAWRPPADWLCDSIMWLVSRTFDKHLKVHSSQDSWVRSDLLDNNGNSEWPWATCNAIKVQCIFGWFCKTATLFYSLKKLVRWRDSSQIFCFRGDWDQGDQVVRPFWLFTLSSFSKIT